MKIILTVTVESNGLIDSEDIENAALVAVDRMRLHKYVDKLKVGEEIGRGVIVPGIADGMFVLKRES